MEWQRRSAVPFLLAAGAASAALLLALGASLTFLVDEWELLLHRRGFTLDAFLDPLNEHLVLIPAAMYKAVQATFGMESKLPFQVVATALLLVSAALLFVYLRRCVGDWMALLGTVLILFLGSAWEVILWPVNVSFAGSTAAGIGMLLALEREDRRADIVACVLLAISIAFTSLGVVFAAAAATAISLRGDGRLARGYVVALPLLLYGLWYLGWGTEAESAVSLDNILTAPLFVLEGIASSIGALLGLFALKPHVSELTRPLAGILVLAAAAGLLWLALKGRLTLRWTNRSPGFWAVVVLFLGFWLLAAVNEVPGRTASSGRYMYPGAIFLLLVLAELFRGTRVAGRQAVVLAAVGAVALAGNLVALSDGYEIMERDTELARAELGALEIAREEVDPAFVPALVPLGSQVLINVDARSYLSAVDAFGSPADDESEIKRRPDSARAGADVVLAHALGLQLEPLARSEAVSAECATFGGADQAASSAPLGANGRVALRAIGDLPVAVRIRRFATGSFPVELGELDAGRGALLSLPADGASEPWELEIGTSQAVTVCTT